MIFSSTNVCSISLGQYQVYHVVRSQLSMCKAFRKPEFEWCALSKVERKLPFAPCPTLQDLDLGESLVLYNSKVLRLNMSSPTQREVRSQIGRHPYSLLNMNIQLHVLHEDFIYLLLSSGFEKSLTCMLQFFPSCATLYQEESSTVTLRQPFSYRPVQHQYRALLRDTAGSAPDLYNKVNIQIKGIK